MIRPLAIVVLEMFVPIAAPAQDILSGAQRVGGDGSPRGTISILVNDEDCNPVADAIVDFRLLPHQSAMVHGCTDAQGRTKTNVGPPPLSIIVAASSPGCRADERAVEVETNRTTEVELTLHAGSTR